MEPWAEQPQDSLITPVKQFKWKGKKQASFPGQSEVLDVWIFTRHHDWQVLLTRISIENLTIRDVPFHYFLWFRGTTTEVGIRPYFRIHSNKTSRESVNDHRNFSENVCSSRTTPPRKRTLPRPASIHHEKIVTNSNKFTQTSKYSVFTKALNERAWCWWILTERNNYVKFRSVQSIKSKVRQDIPQ